MCELCNCRKDETLIGQYAVCEPCYDSIMGDGSETIDSAEALITHLLAISSQGEQK